MTTIYLCRHAAYENPMQIFHGRLPGFPLSKEGRQQAERLADVLLDKPITAVYASGLTRANETAEIIARRHGLTVCVDERLMDLKTPLEGQSIAYMRSIHYAFFRREFIQAGGERLREVYERMHHAIKDAIRRHRGKHMVMVSHGDPIMSVVFKYTGRNLYARRYFDEEYVRVGQGYAMRFDGDYTFQSLTPIQIPA